MHNYLEWSGIIIVCVVLSGYVGNMGRKKKEVVEKEGTEMEMKI